MDISVKFKNVYKKYSMHTRKSDQVLDMILPGSRGEEFYAIRDISFEAKKGDVIGLIGVNGSGKSTLSNIIAGIVPATSGEIEVVGETTLIAVNAGLNKELTGRENIELKCLMMGFTKQQIQEMEEEIIEFADIGKFIDQPVKKYSSGMRSRLGFAISVTVDPDVLVIDEALSVGDKTFADKCLAKMNEFKEKGKIIFFVSHSLGQVKNFCNKAMWIEYGEVKDFGEIKEVADKYDEFLNSYNKMSKEEKAEYRESVMRKQAGEENAIRVIEKKEKYFGLLDVFSLLVALAATVALAYRLLLPLL